MEDWGGGRQRPDSPDSERDPTSSELADRLGRGNRSQVAPPPPSLLAPLCAASSLNSMSHMRESCGGIRMGESSPRRELPAGGSGNSSGGTHTRLENTGLTRSLASSRSCMAVFGTRASP